MGEKRERTDFLVLYFPFFHCLITYSFLLQIFLCWDPFLCLKYLLVYRFWHEIDRSHISGLTCHPSLSQKRESTLTECVHELVASLRPAGSVGHGRPAVVGLLVCGLRRGRRAIVLTPTAGAVVIASWRALRVWGTAPTAAAHLFNNVNFGPQLWNKMTGQGWAQQPRSRPHTKPSVNSEVARPIAMRKNLNSCFLIP